MTQETTAIGHANELQMSLEKRGIAGQFKHDSDNDADEAFLYFTIRTDNTGEDYMNLPNSAVYITGDKMVREFDIRLGEFGKAPTESAVEALDKRFQHFVSRIDSGQGYESITHVRNMHCEIPLHEFVNFLSTLIRAVERAASEPNSRS